MLADILGGVLAGSAFGGEIRDMNTDFSAPQDVGHFFLAMKIEAFLPLAEFEARMEDLIGRLTALPPAAGFDEVLYPGEPEARKATARNSHRVPLAPATIAALTKLAEELALAPLVPLVR